MNNVKSFDWSLLDRKLISEIVALSSNKIVGKQLTPIEITAILRNHFKCFKIPIGVVSTYHKRTTKSWIWIGGVYYCDNDRIGKQAITLRLQYNPTDHYIVLDVRRFRRLCVAIADTVLHEIIHMRQYRRRQFKSVSSYISNAASYHQRAEQTYLGHSDEIDAYSFNIACMLFDKFKNNHEKILEYLTKDLSTSRMTKNSYLIYLDTFDHKHNHPVIKKLKNKIRYYLPYAKLGKPYKTSDWLKA